LESGGIVAKRLIVNADDYAMSPGVSRGILEAHARGVVRSASAMVNTPGAAEALAHALVSAPTLGLGLHLNLSFGRPVFPGRAVPSLVDGEGRFFSGAGLLGAMKRFDPNEVRRELEGQWQRFVDATGGPPDHVDSHQHVACLQPDVFAVMVHLAAGAGIPVRDPGDFLDGGRLERLLRRVQDENGDGPRFADFAFLPDTLKMLRATLPSFRAPNAFRYEFYGSGATREVFLNILDSLPDGVSELMCHPGYADDVEDGYREPRQRELTILQDPCLRDAIRLRGIELATFAVL
jgi:predicted glycoside hydrolase/deacetylase ChbG (UPF0249 family)